MDDGGAATAAAAAPAAAPAPRVTWLLEWTDADLEAAYQHERLHNT